MRTRSRLLLATALAVLLAAGCGDDGGGDGGDTGDNPASDGGGGSGDGGGSPVADAGPRTYGDATPGGPCEPEEAECGNCEDDDGDNFIDGDDPQCAGPLDNDEASFATGIPGDNKDAKKQDCFFDGNSGGNCQIDTCCLLDPDDCTGEFGGPPSDCAFNMQCISECIGLVPPGCDCFGCCTICNPATDVCADVMTNPAVSPNCDAEDIQSPSNTGDCVACEKFEDCSVPCEPDGCILCPGQTEDDLPDDCGGMNECPGGETPCEESADCGNGQYCSNNCCIDVVE